MGDPTGFLTIQRKVAGYRPVEQRINDYSEVEVHLPEQERMRQASRCIFATGLVRLRISCLNGRIDYSKVIGKEPGKSLRRPIHSRNSPGVSALRYVKHLVC